MDHARNIPTGSVIEDVYLTVPGQYSIGPRFPNTDEGWDAAVEHTRSLIANASTSIMADALAASLRIDVRFTIKHPDGGGQDIVAERIVARQCRKTTEIPAVAP